MWGSPTAPDIDATTNIEPMSEREFQDFLIANIVNAALKAGAAIMNVYNSSEAFDVSLKSDMSPITSADRAAHNAIKEALSQTRIPILSEEGREMEYDERKNWEMFWLVDPLDGTVEYLNRNNEFTVSIALMSNNRSVAGAIYAPCLERLYIAGEGRGAFLHPSIAPDANANVNIDTFLSELQRLPIIQEARERQRVAISRSHNTPETYAHIEELRATHPDLEVIEQGSSYKFCMLAEGEVDYYVRTSATSEWDTAAGELILSEAGGTTVCYGGGEAMLYNKADLQNPWFICRSLISNI